MRLTKLGHSCVRLDKDGATLVIDPGGWSDPAAMHRRPLLPGPNGWRAATR